MLKRLYTTFVPLRCRVALRTFLILNFKYGHWRSAAQQKPIDAAGKPLPWLTYPAIDFLSRLDYSNKDIFEYGSGFSTLYWAARAHSIVSVESDRQWYERMRSQIPPNCTLHNFVEKTAYVQSIEQPGRQFDVITIDGAWRRECAQTAPASLRPGGMIILDNTDWYPYAREAMRKHSDFIEVDFTGFAPAQGCVGTTSIFFHRQFAFAYRKDMDSFMGPGTSAQLHESPPS